MKLTIKGVPPYDGDYTLHFAELTAGEFRRIKQMSGYTLAEFGNAAKRMDTDWVTALGTVAAARKHSVVQEDAFWNSELGAIVVDFSDEAQEDVADPPTIPAEPRTPTTPSGEPGNPVSELPSVKSQLATGTHSSG